MSELDDYDKRCGREPLTTDQAALVALYFGLRAIVRSFVEWRASLCEPEPKAQARYRRDQ